MIIRNHLRSCVLSLSLCALACFAMIFLSGMLFVAQRDAEIAREAPLKQSQYQSWGVVPGELEYAYTKKLTLYTLNATDSGPEYLNLTTLGPYDY